MDKERMTGVSSEGLEELDLDEQGIVDPSVPAKYRGTASDKRDMQILGKVQVLRVSNDTVGTFYRRSASNHPLIMWDLTDDYFPSPAELQVHHHARLRKHGHMHLGDSAVVRSNHSFSLAFAPRFESITASFSSFLRTVERRTFFGASSSA
jgi:hypothetical protein